MMNDGVFFSLPDELFHGQLRQFLSLKDIVQLDSAIANVRLRPQLLDKMRNTKLDYINMEVYSELASWLHSRQVFLKYMQFTTEEPPGSIAKALGNALKYVEDLDLSGCPKLDGAACLALFQNCESLKFVSLKNCEIEQSGLLCLMPALANVVSLDLTDCKGVDSPVLTFMSLICCTNNMQTLRLAGCLALDNTTATSIAASMPTITSLDLGSTNIGDEGLRAVAAHCPGLVYLDVQCCTAITNEGVTHLLSLCNVLQDVNVGHCHHITDESLIPLVTQCKNLTFFGISHCHEVTDETVEQLAVNNPGLIEVDLSYTTITGAALEELSRSCKQLVEMNLSYCEHMSAASMVTLLSGCEGLIALDLSSNTQVDDTVLDEIISRPRPVLQELNLYDGGDAVDDAFLMGVAHTCPKLQALNVAYCQHVTDMSIVEVATHIPGLRFLDLTGCAEITDAALLALREHCTELQALEVIECKKVTPAAIDAMIELTDAAVTY